jgi:hypothetical protein
MIRGDEGECSGGIVLCTEAGSGRGFQTPLAKARVGLERRWRGFGWGDGLVCRHGGMVGLRDG